MLEEKLLAWLARAGGDIEEMDNENDAIEYQERPQSQDLPADIIHHGQEEKDERPLPATDHGHRKQYLDGLGLCPQNRRSPISDLNSSTLSKHQNPYFVSPKPRTISERSTQSSIRHMLKERSSRRLQFRLIVHPPEGEQLDYWRRLRRPEREKAWDDQFLMPPPKQQTKSDRKRYRQMKKKCVRKSKQM